MGKKEKSVKCSGRKLGGREDVIKTNVLEVGPGGCKYGPVAKSVKCTNVFLEFKKKIRKFIY
jgi:hypothetical protein